MLLSDNQCRAVIGAASGKNSVVIGFTGFIFLPSFHRRDWGLTSIGPRQLRRCILIRSTIQWQPNAVSIALRPFHAVDEVKDKTVKDNV